MKKTAFALLLSLLLVSLLLTSCFFTALEAPQNLQYDGTLLTWDAVENATGYRVTINDGNPITVKEPKISYAAGGKEVKISIVAQGDGFADSEATEVTFKPLGKVGALKFTNDGVAKWDPVELATGYLVRIDGQALDRVLSVTEFTELPVGTHSISVRAVIQGDGSYYSAWSDGVSVTKLGTVAETDITYSEGAIRWPAINGAVKYEVYVNGNTTPVTVTAASYEFDPSNQDFTVAIRAIGDHKKSFDGAISVARSFVFLDPVTGVTVEDGVLVWNPVEGADAYQVKIGSSVTTVKECRYDRLSVNVSTNVQIKPISTTSGSFSNWSEIVSVLILPSPRLQWNADYEPDGEERQNVFWDGITNASGYALRVTSPSGEISVTTVGETQRFFASAYGEVGTYVIEAKAVAAAGSNVYDSAYSSPVKVTRLPSPVREDTNFIVSNPEKLSEGFNVHFKAVSGASGYALYRDGNLALNSTTNAFRVSELSAESVIEEQTYTFKIRATGSVKHNGGAIDVVLSSLSSEALSFTVKVLATPSNPDISGYTYSWGSVNGATGYTVHTESQVFNSTGTSYELNVIEPGRYSVSVSARGNGADVLPSNPSAPLTIHRLEAPSGLRIDTAEASEGVLTFTEVQNATGYVIVFNNDGNAIPVNTISNMTSYITERGTTVYMQSTANYFNEDRTVYYMESPPSKTYNFIKLSAPTFGDVAFNGSQLIWNAPANINTQICTPTYEVYKTTDPVNRVSYSGEKNGTTMDVSYLEGGQSYTFSVKAIGNGTDYINSDFSKVVEIYKLSTPVVTTENGAYVWGPVPNASSYAVYVDGELKASFTHVSGQSFSYTPDFDELKTYQVEIFAIGDGGYTTLDSKPCVIEQKTKQLDTPDFALSYTHEQYDENGRVIVTVTKPTPGAKGYSYTVGGATSTSAEETFQYQPSTTGTITVRVYALGGSFDENGVYCLDSQSQGGSAKYSITLLSSPDATSIKLTEDGFISWTAVSGAIGYDVTVSVDGVETVFENQKQTSVIVNVVGASQVTVTVTAKGNGSQSVSSKTSEATFTL